MRTRILSGLLVLALFGGTASAAGAGGSGGVEASTGTFNIAVGLKWSPVRYTHPVWGNTIGEAGAMGMIPTSSAQGGSGLYGWQSTSLDSYVGFFFHPQIGAIISLDMGYGQAKFDLTPSQGNGAAVDASYFQFGFALGGKFYLTRPTGLRVSPYLYVDFFKYFCSITNNPSLTAGMQNTQDIVGAFAGLHAPLGFNLAFGAEYFFTNSFSLGAEVLGIRFAYVEGDWTDAANANHRERDLYFTLYTAITLNYRFLASASVRLEADVEADTEGQPRPAKRPKARPRPAPTEDQPSESPPAPSPESVD